MTEPLTPFPIDHIQTSIAIAYHNSDYIADRVLPRVKVPSQRFKWLKFPVEESFRRPDTKASRRGRVNEIQLSATEELGQVQDYALDNVIPMPDMEEAALIGYNPVGHGTMAIADYLAIDREARKAALVFDAAQYPAANKVQLAGNDQWSAVHDDSDPIEDLSVGIDACLVRPNRMAIGYDAWSVLRRHPKIVQAIHGNDGSFGIVTRAQVAALFELDEVLVGQSRLNTAKFGQVAVLERIWGKHAVIFRADPIAAVASGVVTFGLTGEWLDRVAWTMHDQHVGMRGATRLRVGESVVELIVASQAAYFIEDAVA